MPPKQTKGKAEILPFNFGTEESVGQHENRPRLTLRYGKGQLNKGKNVDPMRASAVALEPPQDPIYERLIPSSDNDKQPPLKKQRVDARSARAPAAKSKT